MKAISCIYNLRCDSPFPFHKKPNPPSFLHSDISIFRYFYISIFPYLYISIFLYFHICISLYFCIYLSIYLYLLIPPRKNHLQKVPPSIHSHSAKLRRNPDAGFSDILVSGCSRTRCMIWADIALKTNILKPSPRAMSAQSIQRVREPSEHRI